MYEASVAVHVSAAIVGFGATFSYPVIQIVGELRDARVFAMDAILAISSWVAVPATIVVGATGIYQLARGPYGLGDAWLATGLGLYLAIMLVAVAYLAPCYRRARDAVDEAAYASAIRRVNVVGPFVVVAVIATAVLMVVKPS
jgi:uncharacterized membrane protein